MTHLQTILKSGLSLTRTPTVLHANDLAIKKKYWHIVLQQDSKARPISS